MIINDNFQESLNEIAFLLEKMSGRVHGDYEIAVINDSQFRDYSENELIQMLTDALNNNALASADRTAAYWALSKSHNQELVPQFRKWLRFEMENDDATAVFQILVALDLFGEESFDKKNISRDVTDTITNIESAKRYLSNF